jgi:high affinity sulfate transporter 1
MNTTLQKFSRLMPIISWLPAYRAAWLWPDLIAGLTLAAYGVPVAMAYSALAGLPPQSGIYCYIFGGLTYALFASSRHLAIGPTASISVMTASVLGNLAGGDLSSYTAMAALTAGMVGLLCLLAWSLRLSTFVNFISESILLGFKAGAALSIAILQMPPLLGIPGGGSNFFDRILKIAQQLAAAHSTVISIGVGALLLLLIGEKIFPGRPIALAVVVLATVSVSAFGLTNQGVKVVGAVPAGLPALVVPLIDFHTVEPLLELAFACFLLSYVESIAAARTFATRHCYAVDPRQELLALGGANLMVALGHGYPVAGGLSQSAVNEKAGAQTPLALFFASGVLALALFFLTGLLRNIPVTVLAAVVLVAISGFIKIDEFKRLWQISRLEFNVALVAFVGVMLLGILKGVTISAIASILFLLQMLANPHVSVLGRIPGSNRFSDASRHKSNELFPGLFLFRIEAPLLYFNVDTINTTVLASIRSQKTVVKLAVCDLSTSPYIDAAGARMLEKMVEELDRDGIQFRIAEAHAEVREILRTTGISETLGGVSRHTALADIVEDFERDALQGAAVESAPGKE